MVAEDVSVVTARLCIVAAVVEVATYEADVLDVEVVRTLNTEESADESLERAVAPLEGGYVDTHTVGVHVHEIVTDSAGNTLLSMSVVGSLRHIDVEVHEAD